MRRVVAVGVAIILSACASSRRASDPQIAANQEAAQKEIAAQHQLEKEAEQRAADARAAQQRETDQKAADEQAAVLRADRDKKAVHAGTPTEQLVSLQQAETDVATGQLDAAHDIYLRLATAVNASREAMIAAAVGLYRTGDYRAAVPAFGRLGALARGEEDLHYYTAVALYETGQFEQAKKELACALPFIEVTDAVSRYRAKIEQMPDRLEGRSH